MIQKWRRVANSVVNAAGLTAAVITCGSGLAMALGKAVERNQQTLEFLGLGREGWIELHEPAAAVFVLAVFLHIIMHWRQVWARCKQCIHKPRFLLSEHTVLILAILIVLLTAAADIEEPEDERFERKALHGPVEEASVPKAHCTAGFALLAAVLVHSGRRWHSSRSLR